MRSSPPNLKSLVTVGNNINRRDDNAITSGRALYGRERCTFHYEMEFPLYRACKSRGETMRDFRLPEPFDYRSDILTLKSLFRKSSLCLRTL